MRGHEVTCSGEREGRWPSNWGPLGEGWNIRAGDGPTTSCLHSAVVVSKPPSRPAHSLQSPLTCDASEIPAQRNRTGRYSHSFILSPSSSACHTRTLLR